VKTKFEPRELMEKAVKVMRKSVSEPRADGEASPLVGKEVWIGIEDPDPRGDRKGIGYLQSSGVTVHMFDRDLQEEIQEANKAFLGQALERVAAARTAQRHLTHFVKLGLLRRVGRGPATEYRIV